jgi:biopolymer transport protein ExbD
LLLQLFVASANTAAERLVLNPAVATAAFAADSVSVSLPPDATTPENLALAAFNFAILAIGYISVALPAARVVLRERDDQLTAGIQQACRLAVQQNGNNSTPKVVAVLGLLHVNGVAQRILSSATPQAGAMPRISSKEILGERPLVQGDGISS